MKFQATRILILGCFAALLGGIASRAEEIEAIASKVGKGYVRKKLPDGSFQPETYAFGKGDNMSGARVDSTIDKMDFMDVARILAVPLAEKGYFPTRDPATTNELIMVYWGTTRAPEDATESNSHYLAQQANASQAQAITALNNAARNPEIPTRPASLDAISQKQALAEADNQLLVANIGVQAENQRREDQDMKTATLLGYDSWWVSANAAMDGSVMGRRKADMRAELEEDRYFVVITAFDYQKLVKEKKSKFLWEVRFSIREHGNAFDNRIEGMAKLASDYFGRDSAGLHHDTLPEGKVEIGPVKSLGVVSGK